MSKLKEWMDSTGDLPDDVLLGQIVLFTINKGEYRRDEVEQWVEELALNTAFVPEPNKAIHAFEKATSDGDEFDYDLSDGNSAHVLVRDVSSDNVMVTRHLVREIKDPKRRRLAYGKIGEAVFYRPKTEGGKVKPGTERFRLTVDNDQLVKDERKPMQALVDLITEHYDAYVQFMDADKVRAMVRKYVKYLNAVSIKDGVYFVHANRSEELDRLRTLVGRLGHGSSMQLIPLVKLPELRDMVIEAFQTEAEQALTEVVQEIARIRASRKTVTPDAYAKIKSQYDGVITRAKEYTRTMGASQQRTAGAAEVALESLAELQRLMLGDVP